MGLGKWCISHEMFEAETKFSSTALIIDAAAERTTYQRATYPNLVVGLPTPSVMFSNYYLVLCLHPKPSHGAFASL